METKPNSMNHKNNEMKISIENISSSGTLPGPAVIIQIQGDINLFSAKELKDTFNELIEKKIYILLIDLSGVRTMDSSGIATFIGTQNRLNKIPCAGLALYSLPQQIEKMLELTRLKALFRTALDLSEAIRIFSI
ncbi:STAS domain-containing protein [Leptospira noguchii]|uniref:STAS domain-containing protein n=1 Tax=Leptospira noguchii TaxID=28182 RepID=A0A9Q8VSY1_9LEPT|nr:STAS domain-containing protein [Leptospira noguchii]TQE82916.1 STAS domain-containing protein [Leptospira noguchii]UOG33558.1 STAS domain-containing protein [Leptospira noguchii]UOG44397.1 STAS domain-containing protein [Leptospira noguchii]UOG51942.1 STAS domain-containing protein [Leptospira noguchii]UOG55926.1 STAS domain-containing protein [Leptospira noguchii]